VEQSESTVAIIAAIIGNLLIAVTKFVAAAFTGSSAMLSEGIHSLVDTGNGALMLYGVHKSKKPPDEAHPFGHGRELYFWSMIVAISIFGIGGGLSIYEGIHHLLHPVHISRPAWNYAVIGISMVFEGISWFYGWKAFRKAKGRHGIMETIRQSKDPTQFTVVLEDSTALTGLVIAFAGIFFGHKLHLPQLDGTASILIGVLLCNVALLLGFETKSLLIGESFEKEKLDDVRKIAERHKSVRKVIEASAVYTAPSNVVLLLQIEFCSETGSRELIATMKAIRKSIRERYPEIQRVMYEPPGD
jgi:cation diffusion facilitator family transporter